ncbi:MAG: hypothetical protein R3C45_13005 [Phycisphaerales bacterium]
MKRVSTCAGALVVVLYLAGPAHGVAWNDALGGSFQDGTNWGGGAVPGVTGNALFDLSGATYTVSFAANATNTNLIVGRSNVTFDLNGRTYSLTRATPESIFIGELAFDNGSLTVTDGNLNGIDATIGQVVGSSGTLNIPNGGVVSLLEDLWVGDEGVGAMNLTGGDLNTANTRIANIGGSTGDVLLSGATTLWTNTNSLLMGQGDSSLTVQNGAVLNTNSMTVGSNFSSIADVVLDGSGSQINVTGALNLSNVGGVSTMQVRNGADLTSGDSNIGNIGIGADARVTVTGAGSTWTSTGRIAASLRGDAPGGLLVIENGAVVTSVTGAIADLSDSQGAAVIDGNGSAWNMTGDLDVGEGMASLTIKSGGKVSNLNAAIGSVTGDGRTIDIIVDGPDSLWEISGSMNGGSGGTLAITNGGKVTADFAVTAIDFTVDGAGSQWDINSFANFGSSTLNPATISNGGLITNTGASLSSINMHVVNATWNNSGDVTLNGTSTCDLTISAGGKVYNDNASLVTSSGRFAHVTVEGPGSSWENNGVLTIGGAADNGSGSGGVANLTIRNGGYVQSDDAFAATVATGRANILMEGTETVWGVGGDLILGGADLVTTGGTANATIASDAFLDLAGKLKVHPGSNLTLLGGRLRLGTGADLIVDQPDGLSFVFGTLEFSGNAAFGFSDMQTILGTFPRLGPAQRLRVGGVATLNSSLIIDGGTLSVGQLQGSSDPLFLNGRLELTNDSLTIGLGTVFGPNLTLQSNRSLLVGNTLTVNAGGILTVDQTTLFAGSLINEGEVVVNGASARIDGGSMDNMGLLTGNGRVALGITNAATGVVRVNAGNHLIADGGQNFNNGRIDLTGGTLEFTGLIQNNANGLVVGQGTLISRLALVNNGEMAFSGATNLLGDITNNAAGLILVSGVGPTTFFDDLTQNGELRTSAGSTSVFLGTVSGTGGFTGTGTARFEGDFTPGASPADIAFAGDMQLTDSATLVIELLGTGGTPGVDFDRLNIAGLMDLGGTLSISLLGGYTPGPGDSFQVLMAGARSGTFDTVIGADLGGGLMFDVIYGSNDVTLTVIGTVLEGDLNGDGFVGIADLNLVLGNWNQTIPPGDPLADPSGDGFVGIADLNLVLGNWNAGTPPVGQQPIPEPMSCLSFAIAGIVLSRFCRSRRDM